MTTVRRPKWHPQPPQTPRILHLPRRTTRRKIPTKNVPVKSTSDVSSSFLRRSQKGKLENLFDQERSFSYTIPPVVLLNSSERGKYDNVPESEEEKWRFQADMLRAECNFLRMEREIAVKKLEKERVVLEKSLKSAVHTLLSGKKKIREGESGNPTLEEEIEELAKKLVELQRNSKLKTPEIHNCNCNFDKQASLLQKQLEKYSEIQDECCVKEISEVTSVSLPINSSKDANIKGHGSCRRSTRFTDVETLRRKMEGLSKGKLLKRMEEEYGYMLSATTNYSVPSSASTSKRHDLAESSSFPFQQSSQEAKSGEVKMCSGRCKAIVRRIMEQVKAETEQWSQMQEMLGKVREEMEEVQASRNFWEEQALESEHKIHKLDSEVEEWKQKTVSLEKKENQLQKQVQELQQELEKFKVEKRCEYDVKASKDIAPVSLGAQLAREKRMLMCRVKGSNQTNENAENKEIDFSDAKKTEQKTSSRLGSLNRHPFKEISNLSSPLVRQNSRRYVYPLHSPNS
ncbi:myosin-11-like [Chenopodium quinoa]|uniref:myosin-11-like n=1 Tax=Chenopodium quinoa TaxID=63459 RepID=UPI000B78CEBF|nr:myosin-11-like [Chenopodium quinoa]